MYVCVRAHCSWSVVVMDDCGWNLSFIAQRRLLFGGCSGRWKEAEPASASLPTSHPPSVHRPLHLSFNPCRLFCSSAGATATERRDVILGDDDDVITCHICAKWPSCLRR